jgi:hypothetical protein
VMLVRLVQLLQYRTVSAGAVMLVRLAQLPQYRTVSAGALISRTFLQSRQSSTVSLLISSADPVQMMHMLF